MDEDDLEYQPPDEMFLAGGTLCFNRVRWAAMSIRQEDPLKPPPWWLDAKDLAGQGKAKFMIWNSRYNTERRVSKWLVAPLEDFRRAGYLVRKP